MWARLLSTTSHVQAAVVFRYQMSSGSSSLPPWVPWAFSKQTVDQLNKEDCSSKSSTGLSPTIPFLRTNSFVISPTNGPRGV